MFNNFNIFIFFSLKYFDDIFFDIFSVQVSNFSKCKCYIII